MGRIVGAGFVSLVLLFSTACTSYFEEGYYPTVLKEKKIQATRKFQITHDGKIDLVVLATYLNDIERSYYKNLVYFFLEVYAPSQEPINLKRLGVEIATQHGWIEPRYIRLLGRDEYDKVLQPTNKWSRCYFVAFAKPAGLELDKMRLRVTVDEQEAQLDFAFKSLPFQVF